MLGDNSNEQLINLFNSMFCKQSLRKNVYLFNSLNQHMQISIKTIAKQRRVMQITNSIQDIIVALKKCHFIQIVAPNSAKILMKGDEVIVKLTSKEDKKVSKKEIQEIAKYMKFQLKEINQNILIQFQSHAATMQFIERLKSLNLNYQHQILQKNPYKCLQDSINNIRKEKRNVKQKYEPQQHYSNNFTYDYTHQYFQQLPVFIRRSVPSSDQQMEQKQVLHKKYVQKTKIQPQPRIRFNSEQFPTFEKLSLNQSGKQR